MAPRVRGCRWSAIPAADATCSDPDNGKSGMVGVLNKEPKEENLKKGKRKITKKSKKYNVASLASLTMRRNQWEEESRDWVGHQ